MRLFMLRASLAAACLAVLSSCGSDPQAQAPARLQPGLYRVSLAGEAGTLIRRSTAPEPQREVCVSPLEADSFPKTYPRTYFSSVAWSCSASPIERIGNRITGNVSCPLADGGSGRLKLALAGEVAEQSLDVRARMKLEIAGLTAGQAAGMEALEDLSLRLRLERIGECRA